MEYISRQGRMVILDSAGTCLGSSFKNYYYVLTRYSSTSGFYQGIKFISSDNKCYEFFLDTDGAIKEIKNGSTAQNILSNKFRVNYKRFIINGDKTLHYAASSDLVLPRVTFLLDALTQSNESEKIIQNTISK